MDATIYSDGTYLRNNPDWHADDAAWKAGHIAAMLERHRMRPPTVVEVGCGSGEVLVQLAKRLAKGTRFTGYDVSPNAYTMCSVRAGRHLDFRLGDFLQGTERYDLALAIDVFEHVEDCFGFVRALRQRAKHTSFHIPLDLSVQSLARPGKLLAMRWSAGHIHYFTRDTALALLEDAGHKVVDWFYTSGATDLGNPGWKARLMKLPRKALYRASPDAAARILGGYSILALTE
jgi:cyclopropane fatty-acyl-phospholipid synthase-like methyltransferase